MHMYIYLYTHIYTHRLCSKYFCILNYLILTNLCYRFYYYAHFTDEETETEGS